MIWMTKVPKYWCMKFQVLFAGFQVVMRNGMQVSAIAPDYKLLDYDPDTKEYLYQNSGLAEEIRPCEARNGHANTLPCTSTSGSIPIAAHNHRNSRRGAEHIELVRGLSAVLPHEAISSPPTSFKLDHHSFKQSGSRLAVRFPLHVMLVTIRQGQQAQVGGLECTGI